MRRAQRSSTAIRHERERDALHLAGLACPRREQLRRRAHADADAALAGLLRDGLDPFADDLRALSNDVAPVERQDEIRGDDVRARGAGDHERGSNSGHSESGVDVMHEFIEERNESRERSMGIVSPVGSRGMGGPAVERHLDLDTAAMTEGECILRRFADDGSVEDEAGLHQAGRAEPPHFLLHDGGDDEIAPALEAEGVAEVAEQRSTMDLRDDG